MKRFLVAALLLTLPTTLSAQSAARPEDVASPEAIVLAAYESINREAGEPFDWDRFRSLHLPDARLIPNTEQVDGEFRVLTVQGFIDWIDGYYAANAPIGGPDDTGFIEEQIHTAVDRYGDIAQIMSTYQKRIPGDDQVLGHGVNSFNLAYGDGRWWIVSIVWDEEVGAGPIPAAYLP